MMENQEFMYSKAANNLKYIIFISCFCFFPGKVSASHDRPITIIYQYLKQICYEYPQYFQLKPFLSF